MRAGCWLMIVCLLASATARADMMPNPLIWPLELEAALARFDSLTAGAWAATIGIETAVLVVLLSSRHGWRTRLFAGV